MPTASINTLLTLDEMPIDVIKLDRLFFKQEEAEDSYLKERLMEMIVEWGEKNNKDVIAEGIENEDMLNFCKNFNINLIQGYYFSEPVSSAEIINYIRERAWEKEEIEDDFDDFLLNNGDRIEEEAELIWKRRNSMIRNFFTNFMNQNSWPRKSYML